MLYDPKRDAFSPLWFGQILRETANYIDKHGWCQGSYRNREGERCLVGALRKVGIMHGYPGKSFVWRLEEAGLMDDEGRMTAWNDYPGRTKAEVVAWLWQCSERALGLTADGDEGQQHKDAGTSR